MPSMRRIPGHSPAASKPGSYVYASPRLRFNIRFCDESARLTARSHRTGASACRCRAVATRLQPRIFGDLAAQISFGAVAGPRSSGAGIQLKDHKTLRIYSPPGIVMYVCNALIWADRCRLSSTAIAWGSGRLRRCPGPTGGHGRRARISARILTSGTPASTAFAAASTPAPPTANGPSISCRMTLIRPDGAITRIWPLPPGTAAGRGAA